MIQYSFFTTDFGQCAIAFKGELIASIYLPNENQDQTRKRLLASWNGVMEINLNRAPSSIRGTINELKLHLSGQPQSFVKACLDFENIPPFHREVYQAARKIAPGKTITYGELAKLAGSPNAARAVGQAMARNRFPLIVPCHRVLGAGQKPGGFSAFGGLVTKEKLLAIEGVALATRASLFDGEQALPFDGEKAVRALKNRDANLKRIIEQIGPLKLRIEALRDTFESLFEAIVFQQLSGKAAATILARVQALFGKNRFPTPRQLTEISEERLRGAGLSGSKIAALKDLAIKTMEGTVPKLEKLVEMDDEEIIERLTQVRGIGPWTVQMMLIFRLGRPDILPSTDYGIRKGFMRLMNMNDLPTPRKLEEYAASWQPYRTVASWYLWRLLDGF